MALNIIIFYIKVGKDLHINDMITGITNHFESDNEFL
jgi:hypothetical protein